MLFLVAAVGAVIPLLLLVWYFWARNASAEPMQPADPIGWQLTADPSTPLTMAARDDFQLWIVAHNAGSRPADTRRHRLEYLVNGQPSLMLAMAFGNGACETRWGALAPGDTVREPRGGGGAHSIGVLLFPHPGEYELVLRQDGHPVASLHVRVSDG